MPRRGQRDLEVLLGLARELPRLDAFADQVAAFGRALARVLPVASAAGRIGAVAPGQDEPRAFWNGADEDYRDYLRHYRAFNPLDSWLARSAGGVRTLDQALTGRFGADPLTGEFLPRLRIGRIAAISAVAPDGGRIRLLLHRERRLGDFTPRECLLFEHAARDLVLAARRHVVEERLAAHASPRRPFATLGFDAAGHALVMGASAAAQPFLPRVLREVQALIGGAGVRAGGLVARGLRLAPGVTLSLVRADPMSGLGMVALLYEERAAEPRPLASARLRFTAREREVAQLVVQGLSNRGIAHKLGLGTDAVKWHVGKLLRKTRTATRTELTRLLLEDAHVVP